MALEIASGYFLRKKIGSYRELDGCHNCTFAKRDCDMNGDKRMYCDYNNVAIVGIKPYGVCDRYYNKECTDTPAEVE